MRERSRSRDVFAVRHQAVGPESEDTPPDAAFDYTDSSEAAFAEMVDADTPEGAEPASSSAAPPLPPPGSPPLSTAINVAFLSEVNVGWQSGVAGLSQALRGSRQEREARLEARRRHRPRDAALAVPRDAACPCDCQRVLNRGGSLGPHADTDVITQRCCCPNCGYPAFHGGHGCHRRVPRGANRFVFCSSCGPQCIGILKGYFAAGEPRRRH